MLRSGVLRLTSHSMKIGWGNVQNVPSQQRSPCMASELPKGKGRLAAEIIGNIEASPRCQIGATTMIQEFSELKYVAGLHRLRAPLRQRLSVQAYVHRRAANRNDAVAVETSVGPASVISSPALPSVLPTRRLARRNAKLSIGPDGGTPTRQ